MIQSEMLQYQFEVCQMLLEVSVRNDQNVIDVDKYKP
jgi:hypothetical protein